MPLFFPFLPSLYLFARSLMNRELRAGISHKDLVQRITYLMDHDALCVVRQTALLRGQR